MLSIAVSLLFFDVIFFLKWLLCDEITLLLLVVRLLLSTFSICALLLSFP